MPAHVLESNWSANSVDIFYPVGRAGILADEDTRIVGSGQVINVQRYC